MREDAPALGPPNLPVCSTHLVEGYSATERAERNQGLGTLPSTLR